MGQLKKINYSIIFNLIGLLLLLNGSFILLTSFVDLIYDEGVFWGIFISGIITIIIGLIFYVSTRKNSKNITKREGYLIVALGWIFLTLSGSLPYVCSLPFLSNEVLNKNFFSFTNAFFESMSGYTTTGATIFNDIEIVPKALLLWRSITHWIGGMGIIVLTIAILPFLGIGGMQLFVAEAPGITTDKLHPRITDTAKRLWFIYFILTISLAFLLYISGMNVFDAINHSFSTLSTGGFSTKNESIAYWNYNPTIQYIISIFMFIAGTNFILSYFAIKRKFAKIINDEEFRFYLGIVVIVILITSIIIYTQSDPTLSSVNHSPDTYINKSGKSSFTAEASFRHSLFQTLTVITTTGFISSDYSKWTPFLSTIFFALMFLGGSAGSTAGGVKVVRHVLLIKNSWNEFKRMIHPNAIIPVRLNKKLVSQQIIYNVLAFFMIYMLIFIFGSIIMAFLLSSHVPDDKETFSALTVTASSLGNIGPAFGYFSPVNNYNFLTSAGKWFSAFLMLLGRLELFTILIVLTPSFWKK